MVEKWNSMSDIDSPKNDTVFNNLVKAYSIINRATYNKIMVSISGGADSDIVLDICYKCDRDNKCEYVWFDTGLEYDATKRHLRYLEEKYGIKIKRERGKKAIPTCCKEYGVPFVSKDVSQKLYGLQNAGFKFEDKTYEELIVEYPKVKSYIAWWCNIRQRDGDSRFCIANNKWLKEFLISNPPTSKISDKCCTYAKKAISKDIMNRGGYDLKIMGIRRAEGGARSTAYKTCFEPGWKSDLYMPVFWYKEQDKQDYCTHFDIRHSDCYEVYGFKRTGCACCPFGGIVEVNRELLALKKYEPKLYKAVKNIFAESYSLMRSYKDFCDAKEAEEAGDV